MREEVLKIIELINDFELSNEECEEILEALNEYFFHTTGIDPDFSFEEDED